MAHNNYYLMEEQFRAMGFGGQPRKFYQQQQQQQQDGGGSFIDPSPRYNFEHILRVCGMAQGISPKDVDAMIGEKKFGYMYTGAL